MPAGTQAQYAVIFSGSGNALGPCHIRLALTRLVKQQVGMVEQKNEAGRRKADQHKKQTRPAGKFQQLRTGDPTGRQGALPGASGASFISEMPTIRGVALVPRSSTNRFHRVRLVPFSVTT